MKEARLLRSGMEKNFSSEKEERLVQKQGNGPIDEHAKTQAEFAQQFHKEMAGLDREKIAFYLHRLNEKGRTEFAEYLLGQALADGKIVTDDAGTFLKMVSDSMEKVGLKVDIPSALYNPPATVKKRPSLSEQRTQRKYAQKQSRSEEPEEVEQQPVQKIEVPLDPLQAHLNAESSPVQIRSEYLRLHNAYQEALVRSSSRVAMLSPSGIEKPAERRARLSKAAAKAGVKFQADKKPTMAELEAPFQDKMDQGKAELMALTKALNTARGMYELYCIGKVDELTNEIYLTSSDFIARNGGRVIGNAQVVSPERAQRFAEIQRLNALPLGQGVSSLDDVYRNPALSDPQRRRNNVEWQTRARIDRALHDADRRLAGRGQSGVSPVVSQPSGGQFSVADQLSPNRSRRNDAMQKRNDSVDGEVIRKESVKKGTPFTLSTPPDGSGRGFWQKRGVDQQGKPVKIEEPKQAQSTPSPNLRRLPPGSLSVGPVVRESMEDRYARGLIGPDLVLGSPEYQESPYVSGPIYERWVQENYPLPAPIEIQKGMYNVSREQVTGLHPVNWIPPLFFPIRINASLYWDGHETMRINGETLPVFRRNPGEKREPTRGYVSPLYPPPRPGDQKNAWRKEKKVFIVDEQ